MSDEHASLFPSKFVLTNERLYESKDSREMLNGSSGLRILRGLDEVVEVLLLLDQKFLPPSVGEGGR